MAAAAPTLLTMEEYLRTSYKPDCDFVKGVLEERNVGEVPHGTIQLAIGAWFLQHRSEWQVRAGVELRVRVSDTGFRVCDIVVRRTDAPREDVITVPPLVCVEVLSPEDRVAHATVVLEDYRRIGVRNIWLIDPLRRVAYTFGETGLRLDTSERLEVSGNTMFLPLAEIFATLD